MNQESGEVTFFSDALPAAPNSPAEEQQRVTFTAHEGAKLFPTVVVTPTAEAVVDFDFSPYEESRPLSSCFISPVPATKERGRKEMPSIPLCPPRLKLMVYSKSQWVRQSTKPCAYLTENSGTLKVFAKEEEHEFYVTLPQEDVVMNILEISEDLELMDFHVRTLEAFCAVCSHSNLALAKSINQWIGSEQLMRCLQVSGCGQMGVVRREEGHQNSELPLTMNNYMAYVHSHTGNINHTGNMTTQCCHTGNMTTQC